MGFWQRCILSPFDADEDSNGTIDHEELKKCLRELNFNVDDKEINRLYHYCNMDLQNGLQYHEFIVLLCLVFLLDAAPSRANNVLNFFFSKF